MHPLQVSAGVGEAATKRAEVIPRSASGAKRIVGKEEMVGEARILVDYYTRLAYAPHNSLGGSPSGTRSSWPMHSRPFDPRLPRVLPADFLNKLH
jgi:hypothetical protein